MRRLGSLLGGTALVSALVVPVAVAAIAVAAAATATPAAANADGAPAASASTSAAANPPIYAPNLATLSATNFVD